MQLSGGRVARLGGAAGLVFVVTAIAALFLPGSAPKADEVSKIGPYLVDKHDQILASDFVLGIAFTFFLLFLGSLRGHLGSADRDGLRPGAVALAGGVGGTILTL